MPKCSMVKIVITFWRKLLICFLGVSLLLFFRGGLVLAAEPPRVVRVGVYENKPKIYRDENGKVTGLFGDILDYIAKQENWQLSFVDGTFYEGLDRLKTGQIDIMVDVAFSPEREEEFDFTKETVFGSWGIVYVKEGSSINSFKALDGKKVALLRSSVYQTGTEGVDQYVRAFNLNIEFVEDDEYPAIFSMLSKGEVDAAIVSRLSGLTAEKDYPDLRPADIIFSPTELRFALTKNDLDNEYLIERLDFWVKRLHGGYQGVHQQILDKYGLSGLIGEVRVIPEWVYPSIFAATMAVISSWLLAFAFRRTRNITLRVLAKKEWYLDRVVSNLPVVLSVVDQNGKVVFSQGKSLTGSASTQLQPAPSSFALLSSDVAKKGINQTLLGKESQFEVTVKGRIFKTLAYPVLQNGKVIEAVLITLDVTEEKFLEKAKREFVSIVQHQLRTPPTAIKWSLELLEPKVLPVLDKKDKEHWKMLNEANHRMINLANSMSRISEMESGLSPMKPEKFDLPELIQGIVAELNKPIQERQIKVETHFGKIREIFMDKIIIGIIIQALVSNAVYYNAKQGVVKISTVDQSDSLIFQVEDNGTGIPEDLKGKVFTPFSRGSEATTHYPEGMGIGLYAAKTLLSNIGGKIWYKSEPGKGSIFYAEIPKSV